MIHILDLVMFIPLFFILLIILDYLESNNLETAIIYFIYIVVYIILFCVIDYNWIDIFKNVTL